MILARLLIRSYWFSCGGSTGVTSNDNEELAALLMNGHYIAAESSVSNIEGLDRDLQYLSIQFMQRDFEDAQIVINFLENNFEGSNDLIELSNIDLDILKNGEIDIPNILFHIRI